MSIFSSGYRSCNRCGALHDDGTPYLCFDCLDEIDDKSPTEEIRQKIYKVYETTALMDKEAAVNYEDGNNVYSMDTSV